MGSRRVARRRLYDLNKSGESLTSTAGAGMESNLGSQSRFRQGELITTDITIDLAAAAGAAHSFATAAGVPGAGVGVNVIGVSSSSGTHSDAHIMLINGTASAADAVGIVVATELICVEAPAGGEDVIGLWYGTNASGSGDDLGSGGTELIRAADQLLGTDGENLDVGADLDNKYLYLVSSGSAGDYTAGKFVLRLYGYNVFNDV